MPVNNGIKVILDKSNNVNSGNAFVMKRPSAHMMTDRSHNATTNYIVGSEGDQMMAQSSRRHYNIN